MVKFGEIPCYTVWRGREKPESECIKRGQTGRLCSLHGQIWSLLIQRGREAREAEAEKDGNLKLGTPQGHSIGILAKGLFNQRMFLIQFVGFCASVMCLLLPPPLCTTSTPTKSTPLTHTFCFIFSEIWKLAMTWCGVV